MKRAVSAEIDSLDLLLDTICNLFGGILFIALLVCLLLQLTSPSVVHSSLASDADPASLEFQIRHLQAEVRSLEHTLSAKSIILHDVVGPVVRDRSRQVAEQAVQRAILTLKRDTVQQNVDELDANITKAQKASSDLRDQTREIESKLDGVRSEIDRHERAKTRELRTPVVRQTIKRPVAIILRYGRMYVWHRYDASGNPTGLNTDEFVILQDDPDGLLTSPKPTAGIVLNDSPETAAAIGDRLRQFDPDRFFLTVAVRPDSFEGWDSLRRRLVELNFDYDLLPLDKDTLFDRGGPHRGVQ